VISSKIRTLKWRFRYGFLAATTRNHCFIELQNPFLEASSAYGFMQAVAVCYEKRSVNQAQRHGLLRWQNRFRILLQQLFYY